MKATLVMLRRDRLRPGTFTEVVIWRVPRRLPGSTHRYKYRLALVDRRECVLRYDNESYQGPKVLTYGEPAKSWMPGLRRA